jgi:hypothetical protein
LLFYLTSLFFAYKKRPCRSHVRAEPARRAHAGRVRAGAVVLLLQLTQAGVREAEVVTADAERTGYDPD